MFGIKLVLMNPGIGSSTVKKLDSLGIQTITSLQTVPLSDLTSLLGDTMAVHLQQLSHGTDNKPVTPYCKPKVTSYQKIRLKQNPVFTPQ